MSSIYTLIQKTLEIGYLSIEIENQLNYLMSDCCNCDDLDDVLMLKQAIAFGHVKRQATRSSKPKASTKAKMLQFA
jgi:hypothetical protein